MLYDTTNGCMCLPPAPAPAPAPASTSKPAPSPPKIRKPDKGHMNIHYHPTNPTATTTLAPASHTDKTYSESTLPNNNLNQCRETSCRTKTIVAVVVSVSFVLTILVFYLVKKIKKSKSKKMSQENNPNHTVSTLPLIHPLYCPFQSIDSFTLLNPTTTTSFSSLSSSSFYQFSFSDNRSLHSFDRRPPSTTSIDALVDPVMASGSPHPFNTQNHRNNCQSARIPQTYDSFSVLPPPLPHRARSDQHNLETQQQQQPPPPLPNRPRTYQTYQQQQQHTQRTTLIPPPPLPPRAPAVAGAAA
ncbi:hypothetical protein BX661DRAFT_180780, partial [Kickxella alabastrina]|uniref:uncharacterized protein n=1 Tax=Kickxella alabastrina TaxID=61397 RepID=UPI002220061C